MQLRLPRNFKDIFIVSSRILFVPGAISIVFGNVRSRVDPTNSAGKQKSDSAELSSV